MIRILVVDDHEIVISGLIHILKQNKDIEIIGTSQNGEDALHLLKIKSVDIILLDISMPVLDGLSAAKIIKKDHPSVKIIFFTSSSGLHSIRESMRINVEGYILKSDPNEEIIKAIQHVYKGYDYYSYSTVKNVFSNLKKTQERIKLSVRQKQVLKLIAEGFTSKEIAQKLHLSLSTVNTHRKNLIDITGVHNSQSLINFAKENDLI